LHWAATAGRGRGGRRGRRAPTPAAARGAPPAAGRGAPIARRPPGRREAEPNLDRRTAPVAPAGAGGRGPRARAHRRAPRAAAAPARRRAPAAAPATRARYHPPRGAAGATRAFPFSRHPRPPSPQVGLDAAGKTTILYKLKLGEIVTTIPTIGE
jgi:hypothetical protein